MNSNSKKPDGKRDLEDVLEDEPQSKHGLQGQAKHNHERAGPNSEEYGDTIAPQKGNPRETNAATDSH